MDWGKKMNYGGRRREINGIRIHFSYDSFQNFSSKMI